MQRLYLGLALVATFALAIPAHTQTGNGAPSGPHYNLNIIGVTQGKNPPLTGSDRHTIFVPLVSDQSGDPDTLASDGAPILLTPGPFTAWPISTSIAIPHSPKKRLPVILLNGYLFFHPV